MLILLVFPQLLLAEDKLIKIGTLSFRSKVESFAKWQPTAEYISSLINGYTFKIIPMNYPELDEAVDKNKIDFVLTNTGHYVILEAEYDITRIVTLEKSVHGKSVNKFGGVIFTRSDRKDINKLTDLKGKKFLAVGKESLGGFLVAWEEFYKAGINPFNDFSKLSFNGMPHDEVVFKVRDGFADAGTVRTSVLESLAQAGRINLSDFKILNQKHTNDFPFLHSTNLYPEWPFSKMKTTDNDLAKKVALALLNLRQNNKAAMAGHYMGWGVPMNYQPVHKMMKKLHIGPYKKQYFTFKDVVLKYFNLIAWTIVAVFLAILIFVSKIHKINLALQNDIMKRKNIEEELRESEEKYRLLFNSGQDSLFFYYMNADGKPGNFMEVNEIACKRLGYTRDELLNLSPMDINISDNLVKIYAVVEQIQREKHALFEITHVAKNGKQIPVEINSHLFELNGKTAVLSIARDITKRKLAEDKLKKYQGHLEELVDERTAELRLAKEAAESANRAKSEFIANMSHEIHTPLNAVIVSSDLLSQRVTDKQQKSYLSSIQIGGKTLLTLIDSILDFAKIEAGQLEIELEIIEPKLIISELEQVFALKMAEKGLKFIMEIDESLPPALELDKKRLQQVLFNLVGNAVKFTENGYVKISVSKVDNNKNINLIIAVEDTGIGIHKNEQENIFGAFQQLDGKSTRKYGGTGLGLAISKRLIELMNGEISIQSQVGLGSIFEIILRDVKVSESKLDLKPIIKQESKDKTCLVSTVKIEKLPELLEKLDNFLPRLEKFSGALELNKVEEFGNEINMLGKEYNVDYLVYYGEKLCELADDFESAQIRNLLNKFPELIKEQKNAIS